MTCQNCKSSRIVSVSGKCDDQCSVIVGDKELVDYMPYDLGLGGGDYIEFSYCLDCGQIQGMFPLKPSKLEQ